MAISSLSFISESIYQNIQNNPPIKLTLCERISKIFSRLYEKISNLFSRKPNQIRNRKDKPIYDVPQNNRPVKNPTLYERISNLFSKGPSRIELLEEKVNRENAQLQQRYQELHHYICVNVKQINRLETCVQDLKDAADAKEAENNSLKETISNLKLNLHQPISRSDSGFSESPPLRKKHGLFFKSKA